MRHFRELFNKAAIPLCFVNKEGGTLDFNVQFEKVFGYTRREIPSLNEWWLLAYPDPEYREQVREGCDTVLQRAIKENSDIEPIEYNVTCKNGDVRAMVVYGSFVGADLLLTFFDITDRKRAEKKLLWMNEDLEQRIQERTADLEAKNKELERMNKLFVGRELRMVELKKRIKDLEIGK